MKLTPTAFAALAQLLRLRSGPAATAASLVLTEGIRPADAARTAGCSANSANNAVAVCRKGVDLVEQVHAGLTKENQSDEG